MNGERSKGVRVRPPRQREDGAIRLRWRLFIPMTALALLWEPSDQPVRSGRAQLDPGSLPTSIALRPVVQEGIAK